MRENSTLFWLMALVLLAGCGGRQPYRPQPLESVPMTTRAQTQQERGLRVTAAVPTPEEAEAIFGIPVYERRVQPVWLQVENTSESRVRYAPVGTDRDYFSPMEVWYTNRGRLTKDGGEALQRRLDELAMPRQIPVGATRSGFVFTHASPGTKSFNVDLYGVKGNDYSFVFFIDVPGFVPDHAEIDLQSVYDPDEIQDLDLGGLRETLRAMPCCAALSSGVATGLPLNVVFVGQGDEVATALLRGGWHEIARPTTALEKAGSARLYGRVADAVFRLARGGDVERNELRVWLAPLRVAGEPVWLAQMSHYVRRLTGLGTALLDAQLDPDVDDARNYILQSLWYAQAVDRFAFVAGERLDTASDLSAFFAGSRYFSDGHRLVLWPSAEPVSLLEARNLNWADWPDRDLEALAR